MQQLLDRYWRDLQKKMGADQVFYMFVILIFSEYHIFTAKHRNVEIERVKWEASQDYFLDIFADIHDYVFKEAFYRFSSMVDWKFILNSGDIQQILGDLKEDLGYYFYQHVLENNEEQMLECMEEILEIVMEWEGRTGNYITTPRSIRHLLLRLFGNVRREHMAELCCGTAIMGISFWKELVKYNGNLDFYGADIDVTLCNIAKLNLYFHRIHHADIEQADLIIRPKEVFDKDFDFIIMDIPRGRNGMTEYDPADPRLMPHNKKMIYSDWIFIQDALYRLNDHGVAAVLATAGALIRMNEACLREQLIQKDWIEAVITLPDNLYSNTRVGTELLIFNKAKDPVRQGKILFIDISQYTYRARRNSNAVSEEGIDLVQRCFYHWEEIPGISAICRKEELDQNVFSLKPVQYIQDSEDTVSQSQTVLADIAEIVRGSQVVKQKIQTADKEDTAYFLNIKDIQDDRICFETAERIEKSHSAWKEKFKIQEDDLLITSKGTAIKMAVVEPNPPLAFISGNITRIRVDKRKYHPYVLLEFLNSAEGREALEQIQSGTTIRILNNANLNKLKIPEFTFDNVIRTGEGLKQAKEQFDTAKRQLSEEYEYKRNYLLKLLEEEEK